MAKTEEIEKLKAAFTPHVTITAFKDVGESIVAKVEQDYPRLGNSRIFKVIMDKESGQIENIGFLFDK